MFFRRSRFFYRLGIELALKYRFALLFGFILGLTGSLALLRAAPLLTRRFLTPTERVGIVGDFSPTSLPLAVQTLISGGLTTLAADGSAAPGLAASWEATASGKIYVFHLRTDARWHNGKMVEASDVNYNIRDVTVAPIDKHTLGISLGQPYSPFPTLVAKPLFKAGLVGFGPYRVDSIRLKGDSVQYLKLLPVDRTVAHVKEFRFFRTQTQAMIAYKRGDVDLLEDVTAPMELVNWRKTTIEQTIHYDRVVGLFFNMNDGRLGERSFRQGLSYAVPDLPEEAAYSPFPKHSWVQTEAVKKYHFDEAQAKKLLKNAAAASASAQLTISTFLPLSAVAEAIAKSWTSLGVPTTTKIINDISEGYQILLTTLTLPPDPDQYLLWHSTQKDTNLTGYANAKIDKLLEDGRRELTIESRKKIYADFSRRLTDDTPVRFLYYPKTFTIKRTH
ncbi:ABC transporter substrate-binding protein [Candidatus Gottesmanbacteria bacterium]|nr:ABC transporter substrate-binding protein [Candidatus Gottesmanbacteria bacterium]